MDTFAPMPGTPSAVRHKDVEGFPYIWEDPRADLTRAEAQRAHALHHARTWLDDISALCAEFPSCEAYARMRGEALADVERLTQR